MVPRCANFTFRAGIPKLTSQKARKFEATSRIWRLWPVAMKTALLYRLPHPAAMKTALLYRLPQPNPPQHPLAVISQNINQRHLMGTGSAIMKKSKTEWRNLRN